MRITTDIGALNVDNNWRGFRGLTFLWTARYVTYGIGVPLFFAAIFVESFLGVPGGKLVTAFTLLGVVSFTAYVAHFITYEKPVRVLLREFWGEVTAPRQWQPPPPSVFRPGRVKIDTPTVTDRLRAAARWMVTQS